MPDQFEGTRSDALRLLADWFDDDTIPLEVVGNPRFETTGQIYRRFIELPAERKFTGCLTLQYLDAEKNIWVNEKGSEGLSDEHDEIT